MIYLSRRNCVSCITCLVLSLCLCGIQYIYFEYIWWKHILSDVLKWKTHICHNALIRMTFCYDVRHFIMACYIECRRWKSGRWCRDSIELGMLQSLQTFQNNIGKYFFAFVACIILYCLSFYIYVCTIISLKVIQYHISEGH